MGVGFNCRKRKDCVWARANFDTSRVSYSSLSKVVEKDNNNNNNDNDNDNNNAQFHYADDYTDSPWDSNSKSSPPHHTFYDEDFAVDGEGYDSTFKR